MKRKQIAGNRVRASKKQVAGISGQIELEETKKGEELLRMMVESASEAILLVDAQGVIRMLNPGCERMFSYKKGELIGKKIETLIPERFRAGHVHQRKGYMKKPLTRPMGVGIDLYGRKKNGMEFPVEISLNHLHYRGMGMVRVFIHDITQRRKNEAKIKKAHTDLEKYAVEAELSKETFQQYLDIAGVILLVIGKDGKVMLINKKGCEILGYKEEEIVGKNWFDNFLPRLNRKELKEVFNELMQGHADAPEKYENSVLRKDGQERIISWTNTLIRDKKGKPITTLSSGQDITDQKALERKVLEAMVHGQEQERERLAKELHDGLGVLLSSAKANLGALEPGITQVGKERTVYFNNSLKLLDDAIHEIRAIISDLSPPILEAKGLVSALKDLCDKLDQSNKFSVKFYSLIEGRLGKQTEQTLYRISQELVNNAMKYSKADTITMQLIRHGDLLTLTVEDNGIGFDSAYLFEHDGKGFKNISGRVKHLGGNFHIESSIGNGTLAAIEVPLEKRVKK